METAEWGLARLIVNPLRWLWAKTPFPKIPELERRIAALEQSLAKCPGDGCKYCGQRSWRLRDASWIMGPNEKGQSWRDEKWGCDECGKEDSVRHIFKAR